MEVKIKADYVVLRTTVINKGYEGEAPDVLGRFLYLYEGDTYCCEEHLLETFLDFLLGNVDLPCDPNFDEELLDTEEETKIQITNWEEILPELAHMIVPEPELTCCEQSPNGSIYCNTCGKKL